MSDAKTVRIYQLAYDDGSAPAVPCSRIGSWPRNVYVVGVSRDVFRAVEPWWPLLKAVPVAISADFADYTLPSGAFALHAFLSLELGEPP